MPWIFIKILILNILNKLHSCMNLQLWKHDRDSSLWDNYTLFKITVCGLNKHLFTRPVKQLHITLLQMKASIFRNSYTKPILSILFCQMSKFILSNFDFYLFIESRKYVDRIITFQEVTISKINAKAMVKESKKHYRIKPSWFSW